jgi:hypothetical protein
MLKDELNFDIIKFREMARPFIRYFIPLLNGPRTEKNRFANITFNDLKLQYNIKTSLY